MCLVVSYDLDSLQIIFPQVREFYRKVLPQQDELLTKLERSRYTMGTLLSYVINSFYNIHLTDKYILYNMS